MEREGGDGQLVLLWSYLKRRFPEKYKNVLIDSGDFHAWVHLMIALQELFWQVATCCFAMTLEIDNVYERMKDLENNTCGKLLALNQAVTVAIVLYFTKCVTKPPPQLLYANPDAYRQQLNSSGGLVLFYWLLMVGSPVFTYQSAIRTAAGGFLPRLHAYAFHIHRCVHKTQEVRIMLIALVSFYCIHPALMPFKLSMCALSLLGLPGCCMAYDRVVEWVNARQSARNSCHQAADSSLQFTPHLQSLLHVDAAYSAAALGLTPDADRGYDARVLNQANRLLELFVTECGTDLTQPTTHNPFYHTGNHVPLAAGEARHRRPWEFVPDVESGRSHGRDAAAQSASSYVVDYLRNHMFSK